MAALNSIGRTPQARDDIATVAEDEWVAIDVLANARGGAAKSLYSIQQNGLTIETAEGEEVTLPSGSTIRIEDGKIVYSAGPAFGALGSGQTATDSFDYAIRLGNGTLSTASVTVTITGADDALPVRSANAIVQGTWGGGYVFNVAADGSITNSGTFLPNGGGDIAYGLATGFVNADAFMDVLVLSDWGGAQLYYGNADGSFTNSGQSFPSAFQTRGLIADFNNDGLGDVVVNNTLGSMDFYMNTGAGFNLTYSYTDIGSTGFYRVSDPSFAGDINGDGNLDMFVRRSDDFAPLATDKILFGDGLGGFTDSGIQTGPKAALVSGGVALGDINGDGSLDIVRADATGGFSLLINDGSGGFTPAGEPWPAAGAPINLGDFDGNGTLDALLRLADQDGGAQWWSNDGDGNFTFANSITPNPTYVSGIADFNQDGAADLYGAISGGTELAVYLNDGVGNFSLADSHSTGPGFFADYLFV